ncbi:class I SAM-dependent methyltransferase [Methanobrevibacter sp.]|uniref:class I SAM-dependent methyltransferase n=1 Tax=Methanobrevibacter sp. TaxID=66852 RepID=UPI003891131A
MPEFELIADKISNDDNTTHVEMSNDEIWFLKHFIKTYKPKKIVEIGVASGGNTVNILKWKEKDAKLFSVDISTYWWKDKTKLTGFMASEMGGDENWKLYNGYDYLDVYEEIGNDIDCIIIDTTHVMPGECLTFLATLPQLKDGCIVILHDIHLNMVRYRRQRFEKIDAAQICTGLLFGSVRSNMKWILKTDSVSNIGAFVVDEGTRANIKDLFHTLCTSWHMFPSGINFFEYKRFIEEKYTPECSKLFNTCVKLHADCFNVNIEKTSEIARIDIINRNNENSTVEILNSSESADIDFPDWFKYKDGKGAVLQSKDRLIDVKLKCVGNGKLTVYLRGPDVRSIKGERVPSYVDFTRLNVNNEVILNEKTTVCHDDSYVFEKDVKDGDIIDLHFEWAYHVAATIPFE